MKTIAGYFCAVCVIGLYGTVGSMDMQDQEDAERRYCKGVSEGIHPAYRPEITCEDSE